MIFLSTLTVLALTLWWGIGASIQRDEWFDRWVRLLHTQHLISATPVLSLVLALCVPVLILIFVCYLIVYFLSASWLFFVYVPVLFYSLGRGNLTHDVQQFLAITQRSDTVSASRWVDALRGNVEPDNTEVDDWQKLHSQALDAISYRSFERLFAVLFWFFILGPVGALIYRLSVLYAERTPDVEPAAAEHKWLSTRWLRLVEWPGVRALALSWALVGNFDSCLALLKRDALDFSKSSLAVLGRSLRGALGMTPAIIPDAKFPQSHASAQSPLAAPVISGINTEPDSLGLIIASLALIPRALLLWICVAALITLLI